jgi:mono/diheme cytochrome c family protein
MSRRGLVCALGVLAFAVAAAGEQQQSREQLSTVGYGRGLYLANCAACHGPELHGVQGASVSVPDLSLIAVRDGGFKALHVRAHVAEGTPVPQGVVRAAGEMPNWQHSFARRGSLYDPAQADRRFLALVRYLEWAQQQAEPNVATAK